MNIESTGSSSPITNNMLLDATDDSTLFEQARLDRDAWTAIAEVSGGVLSAPDTRQLKQLKRSWLRYHSKREKGIRENTYAWTDELLVASAITDAFSNNCIAIILTNDWDQNVVMKQFIDNVIAASVDLETQDPETWWGIFADRSKGFDKFLRSRRLDMTDARCDGDIINGCKGGDVFIWQYPSERLWEFSFKPEFKNSLRSIRTTA